MDDRTVAAILDAALAVENLEKRNALIEAACRDDLTLRRRIEALLAAKAGGEEAVFKASGVTADDTTEPAFTEGPGAIIGRYKLLEQIGEGGFGVVYMADQLQPIERRVALKIIKQGMDTKQVIARFEAERQALALMDHSNIAKILDAGTTESGRPFFVMELVRGVPVTEYCDDRSLTTEERLRLFTQICSAVQHAHQKGIIHRDLKPSNVLVSTKGDTPVPKVIDFGIAKATQGRLTDKTLFTQFRQFIGTPAYMSPEQAQMSAVDVDTRSDIYSLGVLLYELLTSKTPLDATDLQGVGYEEVCRRIREVEALAPSKRISSLQGDELETVAKCRRVGQGDFPSLIRGELDWIALKAIDKDRSRRYASADAMAEDIDRFINGEPVTAVPPSSLYLMKKFMRRNHRAITTAGIVVTVMLIAMVVSVWFAISKTQLSRQLADQVLAKDQAQEALSSQLLAKEAARAEAELNVYMSDMNRAYQAYDDADVRLAEFILNTYRESHAAYFEWKLLAWLCATGDAVHTIRAHRDAVQSLAFSSNGTLASCAADGTVTLHDAVTHHLVKRWKHSDSLRCLAISSDGHRLAMGDDKGRVLVCDTSGWQLKTLAEYGSRISALAFSSDGRLAVSIRSLKLLEVWGSDWSSEDPELRLTEEARGLEFSPSGDLLATAGDELAVRLWSTEGSEHKLWAMMAQPHTSFSTDASFSRPEGKRLATASWDGVIKIWENADVRRAELQQAYPEQISTFRGHRGMIESLEYSPDGTVLASAGQDNTVRIWAGQPPWKPEETPLQTFRGHTATINDVAFSHDGQWLASASADSTVKIWPGKKSPAPNVLLGHQDWVFGVTFSPDGDLIASGAFDGEVRLWSTATQEEVFAGKLHEHQVFTVAFSHDGRWLASCDGVWRVDRRAGTDFDTPGSVQLLDLATEISHPVKLPTPAGVRAIDFSPDGSFAIGDHNGRLWLLDVNHEPTVRDSIQVGDGIIDSVSYSPDGTVIAVSLWRPQKSHWGPGRELICYRVRDVEEESRFSDYSGSWRLAFAPNSPTGPLLAATTSHGIDFFHLEAGQKVGHWEGHSAVGIAYSPDGKTLATSGMDHNVRLWNVESGKEVAKLVGHRGIVSGLAFSNDGSMMASSSEDKTIRIWRTLNDSD